MILVLGLVIIYAGKLQVVEINKSFGVIRKIETSIFCIRRQIQYDLHKVEGVKGLQRGDKGSPVRFDNRHYELMLCFKKY
jgi:hypothetical protein